MTDGERVEILTGILIDLHTARWTGNQLMFAYHLDKIAAFSYARTNSNAYETDEEEDKKLERTLLALRFDIDEYDSWKNKGR